MPRFGWKFGPSWGSYYQEQEVTRDQIQQEVTALLKDAQKGDPWKDRWGNSHYPIEKDGEIVGHLWEDAKLQDLEVGSYWVGTFGKKVELINGKRVVGMVWLPA